MSSPEASPSDDSTSPPPPSGDSEQSPPPPPSGDSEQSPPPPPSGDSEQSPPPPPSGDSEQSPPPPPTSGSNSTAPSPDRSPPVGKNNGKSERATPRVSASSDNNNKNNNNNSDSNDSSLVAGVAAAVALLVLVVIVLMVTCFKRNKRKRRLQNERRYYTDNRENNNNYNQGQNWQNDDVPKWQKDAAGNKMHSAGVISDYNWQIKPPPPPPPMMISSEMISVGFSGPHQAPLPPPHPVMAMGYNNQSSFSYDDLAAATGGFAQANLLGQGGFGYVHKGVLPNGKEIAVKSLKANSGQGEREFQAEVDIIGRVHHRHLVSLVGYCIAGSQRMLVYEFVPNGTLEYHLHGAGCPSMDWSMRLKIALGSAKGFAYLHEDCHPRIIHRDIKTANILIDENFEAKVADFGLAKLSSENFTHVSTRIMGTFGYLAPEYASTGKLTEKSDCYSYGIMLLELITGRRPVDMSSDDDGLVDWAKPILTRASEGGSFEEMVDPRLGNNYDHNEMLRAVLSAAACIRHSARRRPKMSQIVRALEGDVSLDDLDGGVKKAQIAMFGSSGGSELDLKRLGMATSDVSSEEGNSQEVRANRP